MSQLDWNKAILKYGHLGEFSSDEDQSFSDAMTPLGNLVEKHGFNEDDSSNHEDSDTSKNEQL